MSASYPGPPGSKDLIVVDGGILRAQLGVATTIASLAWYVVQGSHAVDTITVVLRHSDGSRNQQSFVAHPTMEPPLEPLPTAVQTCALPT